MPFFHPTRQRVCDDEHRRRPRAAVCLLAVLVLFPIGTVLAAEIEVGTSLGVTRATIGGSSPPGSSFASRASGSAAVDIAVPLARDVSLLLEPGYTVQGATVTVEKLDETEVVDVLDVRIPYVALPVGLRVASSGGRGFVVVGLEPRWLQQPEATLLVDPHTVSDLTDRISSFDLAMNLGAGYAFPWRPVRASLEVRYSQGLINLDDGVAEHVGAPFPLRFRTTGLGLMLRLMVPLHFGNGRG